MTPLPAKRKNLTPQKFVALRYALLMSMHVVLKIGLKSYGKVHKMFKVGVLRKLHPLTEHVLQDFKYMSLYFNLPNIDQLYLFVARVSLDKNAFRASVGQVRQF